MNVWMIVCMYQPLYERTCVQEYISVCMYQPVYERTCVQEHISVCMYQPLYNTDTSICTSC